MRTPAVVALILLTTACSRKPADPPEPKRENGAKNGRLIQMNKAAQSQVGIATAPAAVMSMAEYLTVTGAVQPVDARVAHVRPLARGRIQEALVRVGDRVRQGQALARFDNLEAGEVLAQYQSAEAELRKLKIAHQSAARQTERNRKLADLGAVPWKDFEASEAEGRAAQEAIQAQESVIAGLAARLRRFGLGTDRNAPPLTAIGAPISGVVIAVATAPGEIVDSDKELFTVADVSTVWVQAEVYERDLGRIRTGQTASVQVDTYEGRRFTGKVTYIGDVVDPKTRSVRVRCEIANPSALLKLDMFATINLPTVRQRQALAIPESAIQQHNGKPVVFVRKTEETFEARPVTPGMTVDGFVEIASGLSAGEVVVTEGSFHLKSVLLEGEIAKEE